ncbi:MAG: adenylyltransferase/cytidyltransferase family protein [Patescibacteria group bacterium]|nr:adenylyltransferase/cytidyltransferase family protein [Patescibacteria group bacterium]
MKKVFVSGTYDILHAGHVQFFEDAKRLGGHLTVCFASDEVLKMYKGREPSLPADNKKVLIGSLSCVDKVVSSSDLHPIFDFITHLKNEKPDILAVTEDDKFKDKKKDLCAQLGIEFAVLPKRNLATPVSTTRILQHLAGKERVPLRVDFAGGWLDVPRFARPGSFIVNCAISPLVSSDSWPYELSGGLGGSAAHALLAIKNGVSSELNLGVGWQDPAVIEETGLCVWRSGKKPVLDFKMNPDILLGGRMLIFYTGKGHYTPDLAKLKRDFDLICRAGKTARDAVIKSDLSLLARAISMSYRAQLGEGMEKLPDFEHCLAKKYLGGGHGGYALYLFADKAHRDRASKRKGTKKIEPYLKGETI